MFVCLCPPSDPHDLDNEPVPRQGVPSGNSQLMRGQRADSSMLLGDSCGQFFPGCISHRFLKQKDSLCQLLADLMEIVMVCQEEVWGGDDPWETLLFEC